jgi:hypothetical protein
VTENWCGEKIGNFSAPVLSPFHAPTATWSRGLKLEAVQKLNTHRPVDITGTSDSTLSGMHLGLSRCAFFMGKMAPAVRMTEERPKVLDTLQGRCVDDTLA